MAFKEATDCCPGTAVIYGAPDLLKVMQFFNGKAITGCCPVLVRDTIFSVSDACDTSKRIRFNVCPCICACITRVVTVPDANLTINRCLVVSNLANATDGELITWNCMAVAATVAVGTVGHFLRSGGVGVAPAFAEIKPTESFVVAVGDETTALTTGTAKVTFRMPYAFTVSAVRGSVTTAPVGAAILTVDIHETGTTIMACCKIEFDSTEFTSTTACMTPVVSDTSLADDAQMTIDVDIIGCCVAGAGLKVYIIGTRT